ncbi:MAG: phage/plasmid primase, P4 family [Polyangiales bacterium]
MNGPPIDTPGPAGIRLVTAGEVAAASRANARDVGAGDPVALLIDRVRADVMAAWEPAMLELAARLRGVDDLALQRVRAALKNARADVSEWDRAVNEARRRAQKASNASGGQPPTLDVRERYTDGWNASRFAEEYRDRLRFVPERGWYAWTGTYWRFDDQAGLRGAQDFARELAARADADELLEASKRARTSEALFSRAKIQAIETLARARSALVAHVEDFDRDAYLLNCRNGMVDLRTGALLAHDPEQLCSREVPAEFDIDAKASVFEAFLARVQPDPEVRAYLQRWAGYCATGSVKEQCLVVHWGTGANGKSTFVEAINHVLGRYAQLVPSDVLLARAGQEAHPTERAQLCGLRHALVSETASGKGWNENAVKQLTGDTKMTARYMRQDFFEFTITHKLTVCTNNRPEVRENSFAFWRRVHLIPWAVQIPEQEKDSSLPEKLREESAGILAWIVKGAMGYCLDGLLPPACIRAATESYRSESDRMGLFLEERTRALVGARVAATALYKAWVDWCEARGEKAGSQTAFGERMSARPQFARVKSDGRMAYRDLVLRDPNERLRESEDEAGVPAQSDRESASEVSSRDDREGWFSVRDHGRERAGAGVGADALEGSRALEESGSSLAYADHREKYPCAPCDANERSEDAAKRAGTSAGRATEEEVPLLDVEIDEGWEDP